MTVAQILGRALRWGALAAVLVAAVGAVIGWFAAGAPGLVGALVAAGLAAVFLGLTGLSILLANRLGRGRDGDIGVFFGIVLGGWLVKLVLFVVLAVALRGADWLNPVAFGATAIAAVVATLVVDVLVVARSRRPEIEVSLPGEVEGAPSRGGGGTEPPKY